MAQRFVLPCVLIMTVALGTAGFVYAAGGSGEFRASCAFQAFIHLSRDVPQTPDNQKFINSLAAQQVTTASASGLYGRVATLGKVDLASLRGRVSLLPSPGLGVFLTRVIDRDRRRAILLSNAICDEFVTTIKKQRTNEINGQVQNVRGRIDSIQAEVNRLQSISSRRRTTAERTLLVSQRAALFSNSTLLATIVSLPPDDISVLTRATTAAKNETRSLSKNLIIATVGGLLACFLYILIGEVVGERRRGTFGGSTQAAP